MIQNVQNTSWKSLNPLPNPPHTLQVLLLVFRRVRKIAKIDTEIHVRPSVRMEQPGYHWMDFHEI
jgi:hypothetical protein